MPGERCLSNMRSSSAGSILAAGQAFTAGALVNMQIVDATQESLCRLDMAGHGLFNEGQAVRKVQGDTQHVQVCCQPCFWAPVNSEQAWDTRASLSAELAMVIMHKACRLIRCQFRQ